MGSYVFCGDASTKRVCENILKEEEEMAAWLSTQLPRVTRKFLVREASGDTAKH
jgi:ferritin-like metal-binding protein YciE